MIARTGLKVPGGQARGVTDPLGQYEPYGHVLLVMYTVSPRLLNDPSGQKNPGLHTPLGRLNPVAEQK